MVSLVACLGIKLPFVENNFSLIAKIGILVTFKCARYPNLSTIYCFKV
jgi:hypothetical protein